MKKETIELSIHADYVPDWKTWEGFREIMQNALDENDKGNDMNVSFENDSIVIENNGSELPLKSLLMSYTTKRDDAQSRGEKGEGLNLAMLALLRQGKEIEIETHQFRVVPYISYSSKWDCNVLFVDVDYLPIKRKKVSVKITPFSEEEYQRYKTRFVDLDDKCDKIEDCRGTIFLDPKYKGQLFVKGIWACDDKDLQYSYDLQYVSLDRDRRIVKEVSKKLEIGCLIHNALAIGVFVDEIWKMIKAGNKDIEELSAFEGSGKLIVHKFLEEFGDNAIMVESEHEFDNVRSHRKRPVICNRIMLKLFDGLVDTLASYQSKLIANKIDFVEVTSLHDEEVQNFGNSIALIKESINYVKENSMINDVIPLIDICDTDFDKQIKIANLKDNSLGMYKRVGSEQIIVLDKSVLSSELKCLSTLVHELSHFFSDSGHGKNDFSYLLETIWTAIYAYDTGK